MLQHKFPTKKKNKKKMAEKDQTDLLSESEGPVSTFQSLFAEGDGLWKQGDFQKAVEAFSKALIMKPGDKTCLIARSKCYLLLGNPNNALLDAEEALKEDHSSYKAMFAKAEALYSKGDFEMALLHYHRGYQAKPDVDDFRLGIQKAKEAINNAIGDPKEHKIKVPKGGLGVDKRKSPRYMAAFYSSEDAKKEQEIKDRHEKQLLGELHEDKKYLKHFLEDEESVNHSNERLKTLVSATLNYLDSRIEFWRQQKPIYARKKKGFKAKNSLSDAVGRYALELKQIKACFRNIERCYATKDMDTAISFAQSLLRKLTGNGEKLSDPSTLLVPEKDYKISLSQCYQWFGKIYMSIGNKTTAVTYFKRDVVHCKKAQISAITSLKQLSHIYLSFKKYNDAIIYLTHLLKQSTEPEDLLQAIIDLANAYLTSGDPINAKRIYDKHYAFLDQVAPEDKNEWLVNLDKLGRKLDGVEEEPFVDPEEKPLSAKKPASARSSGHGSKQLSNQHTNSSSNIEKPSSSRLRSAKQDTKPNSASKSKPQSSNNRTTTSSKTQSATKPKSSGQQKKNGDEPNRHESKPQSAKKAPQAPTTTEQVVNAEVTTPYEQEKLQQQYYGDQKAYEPEVSLNQVSVTDELEQQPILETRPTETDKPLDANEPEVSQGDEPVTHFYSSAQLENTQTLEETRVVEQEQNVYEYHDEHFEQEPASTTIQHIENEDEPAVKFEQDLITHELTEEQERGNESGRGPVDTTIVDASELETRFEKASLQDLPKLPSQQEVHEQDYQPAATSEEL